MPEPSVDELLTQVQAQTAAVQGAVGGGLPPDGGAALDEGETGPAGDFSEPPPALMAHGHEEFRRLLAIEVPLIVQLGQRRMNVAEVLRLGVGAIVEFNKPADEEMDLLVNNKTVGKGHAVKVGENFGIKITHIATVRETIRKLGGN